MVEERTHPVGDILNVLHCDRMRVEEEIKRRGAQSNRFWHYSQFSCLREFSIE